MRWIKSLEVNSQEVLRGGSIAFFLRLIATCLALAFNIFVAKLLGAEDTGIYYLAVSVVTISSLVSRIGLDHGILRFVAHHAVRNEWGEVRSIYALSVKWIILSSSIASFVIFCSADYIAILIFNKSDLAEPLRWMALSILPLSLISLHAESLKGIKNIRDAMLVNGVGVPFVNLIIIFIMATRLVINDVVGAYLIASITVGIFAWWRWISSMRGYTTPKATINTREFAESCKRLFGVSLIRNVVIQWGPLIFLGVWSSAVDTAIFGAAARMSALLGFVLVSVNQIMSPKIAELLAVNDMKTLEQLARKVSIGNLILVTPFFIVYVVAGDQIMGLFGAEFSASGDVLIVLAVGVFISGLMGSVGNILIMSGNEKTFQYISLFSGFILIGSCILFIRGFGVMGAAWAATLAIIINNVFAAYFVRDRLRVQVLPFLGSLR